MTFEIPCTSEVVKVKKQVLPIVFIFLYMPLSIVQIILHTFISCFYF